MRYISSLLFLAVTVLVPASASAQGGFGRGMGGMMGGGRYGPSAPKLPGVELRGPLDSALARTLLTLTDDQATRYAQVYDSFMVATQPSRDSANAAIEKMNDRLDAGDRAAAMFYAEQVQDIGKVLKDRQDRFESDLRRFLNGDQVKAYKKWREGEDEMADRKRRADQRRWDEAGFRAFSGLSGGREGTPEIKTALPSPATIPAPALGAQAVRVGRTVYVTGQFGIDSAGTIVGSDLQAQAVRAFANLTAVLQAAGAAPRDVTALTIYVVNYRPADAAAIREAGGAYFGPNSAVATVLGVQSVGRDGALIVINATASARQ